MDNVWCEVKLCGKQALLVWKINSEDWGERSSKTATPSDCVYFYNWFNEEITNTLCFMIVMCRRKLKEKKLIGEKSLLQEMGIIKK